jgi:sporulation-control protein spo0M
MVKKSALKIWHSCQVVGAKVELKDGAWAQLIDNVHLIVCCCKSMITQDLLETVFMTAVRNLYLHHNNQEN